METRKVKDVNIQVVDKDGTEGIVPMAEFAKRLVETVCEAIELTFKSIGKEIKSVEISQDTDFKKVCPKCKGQMISHYNEYTQGQETYCPNCSGKLIPKS